MIDLEDLQRPAVALLALTAAAAGGFAAGYVLGRDPALARRLAGSLARGAVGAQVAFAEAIESLGDLWAEATEAARQDVEEERFAAQAASDSAGSPEAAVAVVAAAPVARKPRARRKAGAKRKTGTAGARAKRGASARKTRSAATA